MRLPRPRSAAEALAAAFLSSDAWAEAALRMHGAEAFAVPARTPWLGHAAKLAVVAFDEPPRSRFRDLARIVEPALADARPLPRVRTFPVPAIGMGAMPWPVPPLATAGELAAWLELTPAELMWFADPRALERRPSASEALRHYRYAWVPKPSGGLRLLEAPKPRTKSIQRRILAGILDHVPAHDAAHGFRSARSPRTHATIHARAAIVMRVDLADFFLSVSAAHVRAIFAALGYPSETSWLLTCLATNVAPVVPRAFAGPATATEIRAVRHAEMLARTRHLPQGAPTSPALANLAAYGLDVRLSAAAASSGARYSRYADDLVFSGDGAFARSAWRWARLVEAIVRDEGFVVNRAKTRLMRRGARQIVTGIVVNETPTIARADVERLEAILYNCVRYGPASQNREGRTDFRAHLRGKIAHVKSIAPSRAKRLEELFVRIVWA